jgi:hypothetical protein
MYAMDSEAYAYDPSIAMMDAKNAKWHTLDDIVAKISQIWYPDEPVGDLANNVKRAMMRTCGQCRVRDEPSTDIAAEMKEDAMGLKFKLNQRGVVVVRGWQQT